jgi:hypothetical protein
MRWNRKNRTAWEREIRSVLTRIYPGHIYPEVEPNQAEPAASLALCRNGSVPYPKIIYDAADLRFVRRRIEPLQAHEQFLIRSRKFGSIQMSKADFYTVFSNVV